METVLIVGVFSFVGYEVAQQCIKNGITVYGIQPMPLCQTHEEKWLGVGRNANFLLMASLEECPEEIDRVYMCLYEPHCEEPANILLLREVIKKYPHSIVVSSVRATYDDSFFQQVELEAKDCTIIRVPTIYGPWQPEEMSFQRMISDQKIFSIEEEEILFITDVATAFLRIKPEKGCYTLTAKEKQHWQEAYYELMGKRECKTYVSKESDKKIWVNHTVSTKKGIAAQRAWAQKNQQKDKKEMDK